MRLVFRVQPVNFISKSVQGRSERRPKNYAELSKKTIAPKS